MDAITIKGVSKGFRTADRKKVNIVLKDIDLNIEDLRRMQDDRCQFFGGIEFEPVDHPEAVS